MTPNIITFDGPSGVGKGTISMMIAEELGYKYLDSGSLYRALALKLYEKNNNFDEILDNLDVMMKDITIDFKYEKAKKFRYLLMAKILQVKLEQKRLQF